MRGISKEFTASISISSSLSPSHSLRQKCELQVGAMILVPPHSAADRQQQLQR
jgi:hypothetical protein